MAEKRKPQVILAAFDPDGEEHTFRTAAGYDYAGFIKLPAGWVMVAKGWSHESVRKRAITAYHSDSRASGRYVAHFHRKGSEPYLRQQAVARAQAADLARLGRRQAQLPKRVATVQAASDAGRQAAAEAATRPGLVFKVPAGQPGLSVGVNVEGRLTLEIDWDVTTTVPLCNAAALQQAIEQAQVYAKDVLRSLYPDFYEKGVVTDG